LVVAQAVKVPVLSIFGGKDAIAPASLSMESLMQAYARGGNVKAAFRLFPDAGHGLQVVTAPVE
jgi:pimeloyl-ACP methyl ester carboxylesterase